MTTSTTTGHLSFTPADLTLSRQIAQAFRERGYDLYLVGGAVRDALLGRQDLDLDFATSAPPSVSADLLEALAQGTPYRIGERFGTIGLRLIEGRLIEVTTYRSDERYEPGSRKPQVTFGTSLRHDLQRRDFTINALALDPLTSVLIDPFDGRADLEAGLIRAVGEPTERFREDPLRLLRAIRFAARLGFSIEDRTAGALSGAAPSLRTIARERVRDEFSKILTAGGAAGGLQILRTSGLLAEAVPGLMELTRMPDHGPNHPLSLWDHTLRVVDGVPAEPVPRWAALLHDIGKPATRTQEADGRIRFFHHEEVGARLARAVLTDLRYPNETIERIVLLVESHMQLHAYTPEWSDGALRRLSLRLGSLISPALQLARADAGGHSSTGESYNSPRYQHLEQRLGHLNHHAIQRLRSPLSGEDLMARYGRPPGPWIGRIKDALLERVVDGDLGPEDRDRAWALADQLAENTP